VFLGLGFQFGHLLRQADHLVGTGFRRAGGVLGRLRIGVGV
jgi:hypothetical protein